MGKQKTIAGATKVVAKAESAKQVENPVLEIIPESLVKQHLRGTGLPRFTYLFKDESKLTAEMKKACTVDQDGKFRVWLPAQNLTGKVIFYRPSWADKRELPQDYRTFGNADDESTKFERTSTFIKDKEAAIAAAVSAGLLSAKEGKERMKSLKDMAFRRLGI